MRLFAVAAFAAVLMIPAASPAQAVSGATALDAYAAATSKAKKPKAKRKAKVEYMKAVPVK